MSAVARAAKPWSLKEFLVWESEQPKRHEFIGGHVYAMAPARVTHARRTTSIVRALLEQIQPPCEVIVEGPLLRVDEEAFVPDVWVVCSQPEGDATVLEDAELIVEVLSPGNRPDEMTAKREAYLTLPSLVAYLLLNDDIYEAWTRVGPGGPWQCEQVKAGEFAAILHGRKVRL